MMIDYDRLLCFLSEVADSSNERVIDGIDTDNVISSFNYNLGYRDACRSIYLCVKDLPESYKIEIGDCK